MIYPPQVTITLMRPVRELNYYSLTTTRIASRELFPILAGEGILSMGTHALFLIGLMTGDAAHYNATVYNSPHLEMHLHQLDCALSWCFHLTENPILSSCLIGVAVLQSTPSASAHTRCPSCSTE